MAKKLAFLVGASALALAGMATVPLPASAGSHVGVDVGPVASTSDRVIVTTMMTIGAGVIAVRIGIVTTTATTTGIKLLAS
jgi:hypothetical protein